MTRITRLLLLCSLVLCTCGYAMAQEIDTTLTLEQRYSEMLKKSETYKDNKVIRRSNLNVFWAALSDTLKTTQEELKAALGDKMDLTDKLAKAESALAESEEQLAMLRGEGATVSFMGAKFNQTTYNAIVWTLIISFGLLSAFLFQRFRGGHNIVKDTQEELDKLQQEYDTLRHKSKDMQMKLKRELQTALNRLETVKNG